MTTPESDPSELLMAHLRQVARDLDPVPEHVVLAGQAAFGLRTIDAELAELVADSLDSAGAVRGVAAAARLLSYAWGDLALELEVTGQGARRRLLGEVSGATGAVTVETPAGSQDVPVDEHGRFDVDDVPAGLVRVRCTAGNGTSVVTHWTRV